MGSKIVSRLGIGFLLVLIILAACRKEEEQPLPTAVPTASLPGGGDELEEPEPTATSPTATPRPTVTAVPEQVAPVDPEHIDWPPQVIYTSPAPGEETILDGAITVRFDQPMDQASVESAFDVQTAGAEGEVISGTFSWPQPDTLVFTPRASLKRQQSYRVQIGEQASSARGFALVEPLDIYLQTVGYLRVSQVIPGDSLRDVQTDSAVTVLFNRPVVPLVSTAQQANLPEPLIFEPPVSGRGNWVSTSIYRFLPDRPLAGATTYQVQVQDDFEDLTGAVLEEPFVWHFSTASPDVVTILPENGATGIAPTQPLTITFNMPMDRASTEAAVSVRSASAPAVRLNYVWLEDDRTLMITPQGPLNLETSYQIGVAQSARSATGQATLERDVLSAFATVPFPAVINTSPARGELAERWQRGFTIGFASPMDWTSLEDRIRVEPDPGEVSYYFYDTQLSVDFELERTTEYIITVPGDARDPYGNTLGADYTWRFRTPDSDPIASFNLPQWISQLSTSFNTEVDILYRNVSRLDVTLTNLGLPVNLLNEPYTVSDYRPAIPASRSWSLPVEAVSEQVNVLSLPLADGGALPTGVYLLAVNAPEVGQNSLFWQNQRNVLIIADTNLVVKEMFGEVHVWITDLATGQPAAGRSLEAYTRSGTQIGTSVSDANGFATFDKPPEDFFSGVMVVSNGPGEAGFGVGQSLWHQGISPYDFGLYARSDDEAPVYAYVYTDRPIYRPGDTVHYKGIVRDANYGRYGPPTEASIELTLTNATYFSEGGTEETFTLELDEMGSFSGDYLLPEDMSLGTYQFSVRGQDFTAFRLFTVAEYRKPEFLITMTPDQDELLRGQPVAVTLEASYFFGGPATDLQVNWNIYQEAYQPDVPGPFYYFSDAADAFLGGFFPSEGGSSLGDYLTGGSGRTDGDGRLVINVPAQLLKDVEDGSRRMTIEASVQDLANFPVSSRASVIMHAADSYVGIVPEGYISVAGTEAEFNLLSVDWDGQAAPSRRIEVVFFEREWERIRDSSFGAFFTRWEAVDTEVGRAQATTDRFGKANVRFVPEAGGTFVAVATLTDDGGRTHKSSAMIWVTDSRFAGWRTDPRERRMDLVADKQDYAPGETARVLVQSPFAGPVRAWLTIERGTLLEQRLITLQGSSDVLEIPITPDFAPNVFLSVVAVKGITPNDPANLYADFRIGITELVVSPQQMALNVSLTPKEEFFAPGDTAEYDIQVTDYLGRPVRAELSLALVDLAVLTLKEDNAPPMLEAFYARQPYRSWVGSGLVVSGEGLEVEVPAEVLGRGGGGGGDGIAELALDRAAGDEDEEDVRRDFPDTAYWRATLRTGADGRASVEIPLPDSLTTWRLSSKAVTIPPSAGTLVGQSSVDVVVTLPLLIRPVTPRFMTVGDVLQLGAIVNNNTDQSIEATVSLEATGLTLHDAADLTVVVPAHGRQLIRWQALVNDVTTVDLTFRVSGGGYLDATKPTFGQGPDQLIPVFRYDAEDIVGTSGVLSEAGRRVEAILLPPGADTRQGTVELTLSPSLAAALIDSLDYVNSLEYVSQCAHAITDRLLPNVATAIAIQELNLEDAELASKLDDLIQGSISQLETLARQDGGWGWCYSEESDPWITAYTLLALTKANAAGYVTSADTTSSASRFLQGKLVAAGNLQAREDVNRQAFFLYVLAETGLDLSERIDALFAEHRALLEPYARALLALAYQLSGDQGRNNQRALLADLNDSAIVSAAGAHWENAAPDYRNLSSDVRGTAMVLEALARVDPGNLLASQATRWLMVAREAQRWGTGHETAWSILALVDWMAASGEMGADYEYAVNVNTKPLVEGSFAATQLTQERLLSVPLSTLSLEAVNFVDINRGLGSGRLYYSLYLDSYISVDTVEAANRGVVVQRAYYDADCDPEAEACQPIEEIRAGEQVRVELTIVAPTDLVYAVVEDPLPAGAEGIDPALQTSISGLGASTIRSDEDYRFGYWGWWYFNRIEYRDEKVVFMAEFLPAGTYQYTYHLQANIPGVYQVMPTIAMQEFFPDVFGRSSGMLFTILE